MVTNGESSYFVYTVNTTASSYSLLFNTGGDSDKSGNIENLTGDYTFEKKSSKWNKGTISLTSGAPEGTLAKVLPKVQLIGEHYGNWQGADAPEFVYDEDTETFTYEESITANLAEGFKILIDGEWRGNTAFMNKALASATSDFVSIANNIEKNMLLTDAADYEKITLTVKKIDGVWKLKVVGEKETVVKIKGEFNGWTLTELEGSDGTYTFTVDENIVKLADGFGFEIDGVYYAGDIELELDGDAVVMTGDPWGKNIRFIRHFE